MVQAVIKLGFSLTALTLWASATALAQGEASSSASAQPPVRQAWVARYDGPGKGEDRATALAVDGQSSVYVTGVSVGSRTGTDYATLKYNPAGKLVWVQRY